MSVHRDFSTDNFEVLREDEDSLTGDRGDADLGPDTVEIAGLSARRRPLIVVRYQAASKHGIDHREA